MFIEDAESLLGRLLMSSDGVSTKRIEQSEHRLGFALPADLKDFHLSLGAVEIITSPYYRFDRPEELEPIGDMLPFVTENDAVCVWAIKISDAQKENPMVYYSAEYDEENPNWFSEGMTLAQFLSMVIHYQCAEGGYPYRGQTENDVDTILDDIKKDWQLVAKHNVLTIYRKDQSLIWFLLDDEPTVDVLVCCSLREADFKALCEKYGFREE